MPRAMRASVLSACERSRSKIDGASTDQSMHSAAVRYGIRPEPSTPCVGCGHVIGRPSQRAIRKKRRREVGAPKSHARRSFHSTLYPSFVSFLTKALNVSPLRSLIGRPYVQLSLLQAWTTSPVFLLRLFVGLQPSTCLRCSGPHVANSSTFSIAMTRGRTFCAQRTAVHARPRIFWLRGVVPFAFEKCLQSGEHHTRPTGRPWHAATGSTCQMFSR